MSNDSENARDRVLRFLNTPVCEWKDIPPGDCARLIPSFTMVVKLTTEQWDEPEYHPQCHPAALAADKLGNAQLLGVVIKTDSTRDDVLPGGLITIAPNAEVEHIVFHGEGTPVSKP